MSSWDNYNACPHSTCKGLSENVHRSDCPSLNEVSDQAKTIKKFAEDLDKPTPETLNKDDALRILEMYVMSPKNYTDDPPICKSACDYLQSLKYVGEVGGDDE